MIDSWKSQPASDTANRAIMAALSAFLSCEPMVRILSGFCPLGGTGMQANQLRMWTVHPCYIEPTRRSMSASWNLRLPS